MSAMPLQKLRQELLVDGDFARVERRQFGLVIVHHDYLVPEVGEARPRYQSHIA
jgi:hypothetical protein